MAWSNLFAQFSEQIALAAAPLAAVLLLAAGPSETGWLQTAQTLPFLLLAIPAGLIVDRASRRALLMGAEALRALSLALIVLALLGGVLSLPLLAVLGFVGAIGTVCYTVAAPALLPSLVPRSRLVDANRWLELARSVALTGGPAVGGAIVGWTGAPAAHVLATVSSLLALGLLTGLPRQSREARARQNPLRSLREAAAFVARHPLLRPIFMTAVVFNLSWFVLQAIYVAYAVHDLGMTATQVGITLGIYGAGMVIGATMAPVLSRRLALGTIVLLGPLGGLCGALAMLWTLWLPTPALAGLSFLLFGVGPMLWTISTTTLRQVVTPNAMLGRVSALIVTATFGARPVGAAIGAAVAAAMGPAACLTVAAVGFCVQLMVIGASPVRRLRDLQQVESQTARWTGQAGAKA